jgi:hypothetical protein
MAFQLFTVPIHDDGMANEELNAFLHQQFGMTDIVSEVAVHEPSTIVEVVIILMLIHSVHWSWKNLKTAKKRLFGS